MVGERKCLPEREKCIWRKLGKKGNKNTGKCYMLFMFAWKWEIYKWMLGNLSLIGVFLRNVQPYSMMLGSIKSLVDDHNGKISFLESRKS